MSTSTYLIPDYSVANMYEDDYNIGYSLLINKAIPFDFDLILVDDNNNAVGILKVHRTVLQVSSGYFSSLLASNMTESTTNSCKVRVPGLTVEEQCRTLPRVIETFYSLQSNKPSTLQDLACHLMMLDYFDFKGVSPYFRSFKLDKSENIPTWVQDMVINQLKGASTDEAVQSVSQALYSIITVLDNMMNSRKLLSPPPSIPLDTISLFRRNLFSNVLTILIIVWMTGIECLDTLKPILSETHRFCDSVLTLWCVDYEPNISHIANCLVNDTSGILKYSIEKTIRNNMTSFGLGKHFCNEVWTWAYRTAVKTYSTMQNIVDGATVTTKSKKPLNHESIASSKLQAMEATVSLQNNTLLKGVAFYSEGKVYTKMMEALQTSPSIPKKTSAS